MAKKLKKLFAMMMVLTMLTGLAPVQAMAEESSEPATIIAEVTITPAEDAQLTEQIEGEEVAVAAEPAADVIPAAEETPAEEEAAVEPKLESNLTTEGGDITVETSTETTESTDEDGNTVITETVTTTTEGTLEDGETIVGEEIYTETNTTDPEGELVQNEAVLEGSETVMDEEPDISNEVEVKVELTPGETTSSTVVAESTVIEGEKPEDPTVGEYEYTESTLTTEVKVEATTEEHETKVEVEGTSELTPIIPDRTIMEGNVKEDQLLPEYTYSSGQSAGSKPGEAPEGYDYCFTSYGQMSMWGNATINPDGSEGRTGALQFQVAYLPDFDPTTDNALDVDEEDIFVAYCADINTGGQEDWWYRIDSLDDAGYYDEEAAEHIRAIALNGYWGTSNEPDEDGNYKMGSLEKLKADMKAALAAGELEGITEEDIDSFTLGQALNATQSAIWMYANETTDGSHVDPNRIIAKGYAKNKNERVDPSEQDMKNAKAIFSYLTNLDPIAKGENEEIIDDEAFIKEDSMSLVVGTKVEDATANQDEDDDNDVYNVALEFALVVTPSADGDDLIVQVVTGFDADGNPIIAAQGRIAGGDAEEDAANGISRVDYNAESGIYTLNGLKLAENANFDFDLKLVGTQHLEQGVYVFSSEVRNGQSSQTFVSVLEGEKEVNVTRGYSISFNVEEKSMLVSETHWRRATDPYVRAEEPKDPPVRFRYTPATGDTVIPDEQVPLADVPQTGDNSMLWFALVLFSACALCVMTLSEKKCKA